jgi:hypothetical protein
LHGEVVCLDQEGIFGFVRKPDCEEYYFGRDNLASGQFTKLSVGLVRRLLVGGDAHALQQIQGRLDHFGVDQGLAALQRLSVGYGPRIEPAFAHQCALAAIWAQACAAPCLRLSGAQPRRD